MTSRRAEAKQGTRRPKLVTAAGYDPTLWDHIEPDSSRRLLVSAVAAFYKRGFNAATTREIGQGAGMSPAAVYVHYKSKHELLYEISRVGHEVSKAAVIAAMGEASDDPVDRVSAFVYALSKWHADNHVVARVGEYELHNLPRPERRSIVAIRAEFTQLLKDELRRGTELGVFDIEELDATTDAVFSLCLDLSRWYDPSQERTPDQVGRLYARLVRGMLGAARSRPTRVDG